MMAELTFIQNHIIKQIFDQALSGELVACPDDQFSSQCGITISSEIKSKMNASKPLRDVLARPWCALGYPEFPKIGLLDGFQGEWDKTGI